MKYLPFLRKERTNPVISRTYGCLFLVCILISLFLPFFESSRPSILPFGFAEIGQHPKPQQNGFPGGEYATTYNGFGSLAAVFNTIISGLLVILLFLSHFQKTMLNTLLGLFLISNGLIFADMLISPSLLSPSDTLLGGYYIFIVSEIGLFVLAYNRLKRLQPEKRSRIDLIDDDLGE